MSPLLGFIFGGMPGYLEALICLAVALLLFGNRLPSVMRSLGQGIVEFKKGVQGIESDIDDAVSKKNPDRIKDEKDED